MVGFTGFSTAATAAAIAFLLLPVLLKPSVVLVDALTLVVFSHQTTDFLAGQFFDIRVEVHAPVNGSEATDGKPDEGFTFTIEKEGDDEKAASDYFKIDEPKLEKWDFTWFEDLFAKEEGKPSLVRVTSKAWRRVALYEPGKYTATLKYNDGSETKAKWIVKDLETVRRAKNVIFFIGDGMTTSMITAARLIGHKSINGKYQSRMMMDEFPVLGHQMTHSLDTFITDSANSASALYTGHKTTVNAMGCYVDSSKDVFDDPKVETIAEIFRRIHAGAVGIVSTAYLADATPAAITGHTRDRSQAPALIDQLLHGMTNYTWTNWTGPDVLFGGGAENFYDPSLGGKTYKGKDYYKEFEAAGYKVVQSNTELQAASNDEKTLGVFSVSNMAKWLDRNVYTDNLHKQKNAPDGSKGDAVDQPGLKEMTLKAIDVLSARGGDKGWFLMSEAASIDKQMHVLDYDRALAELLELDDTIRATVAKLKEMDCLDDTLILVTADHGHGFDVMGSVDTKYFGAQQDDRHKRNSIGVYAASGQSQYVIDADSGGAATEKGYFPTQWDPRYTLFAGYGADPDHREDYSVNKDGPRLPAVNISQAKDYYANPKDGKPEATIINGTLPTDNDQGVHSLTDVPVYAMGPCQDIFGGSYNNIDIFFGIAECLGLSEQSSYGGHRRTGKKAHKNHPRSLGRRDREFVFDPQNDAGQHHDEPPACPAVQPSTVTETVMATVTVAREAETQYATATVTKTETVTKEQTETETETVSRAYTATVSESYAVTETSTAPPQTVTATVTATFTATATPVAPKCPKCRKRRCPRPDKPKPPSYDELCPEESEIDWSVVTPAQRVELQQECEIQQPWQSNDK